MALREKVEALAAARGKRLVIGPFVFNVLMRDQSDGRGPYISSWSTAELGPVPTQADGFTADELREPVFTNVPPTPAPTADQLRDAALQGDTDRQAIVTAIKNATPAQIKTYITNNVTDLASARQMLIKLALLVARNIRD